MNTIKIKLDMKIGAVIQPNELVCWYHDNGKLSGAPANKLKLKPEGLYYVTDDMHMYNSSGFISDTVK